MTALADETRYTFARILGEPTGDGEGGWVWKKDGKVIVSLTPDPLRVWVNVGEFPGTDAQLDKLKSWTVDHAIRSSFTGEFGIRPG